MLTKSLKEDLRNNYLSNKSGDYRNERTRLDE